MAKGDVETCPKCIFLAHKIEISVLFTLVTKFYLTYPYQPVEKIKNEQPHIDPWRDCNVKMTSPCCISANSGFSGSLFYVLSIENAVLNGEQDSCESLGWDRNIPPSRSPVVITRQTSGCQSVILGTDLTIQPSNSWWILKFHIKKIQPWIRFPLTITFW